MITRRTRSLPSPPETKTIFRCHRSSYRAVTVLLIALSLVSRIPHAASDRSIFLQLRNGQRVDIPRTTDGNSVSLPSVLTVHDDAAFNTKIRQRQKSKLHKERHKKSYGTATTTDSPPVVHTRSTVVATTVPSYEKILAAMTDEEGVWRRPQQRHRRIQEEETQKTNSTNYWEEGSASSATDIVHERLSKAIFGIVLCLGLVATLTSLGSCVFIYIHRTNKLIAIGQPPCEFSISFSR